MIAFSPVRQHPAVLHLFLDGLDRQDIDEIWVYDDNTDARSTEILRQTDATILPSLDHLPSGETYRRGEDTHHWALHTVARVAAIKNYAVDLFLETRHDHLFLIDSDVLLPRGLVRHLAEASLPIIASVYWTQWHPDTMPLPNLFPITSELLTTLRHPGHHRVDGLGAATLIHRDVLSKVRFDQPPHLQTEGEDRWFCYHCHRIGIPLVACTHMKPFHFYRDSQLNQARRWMKVEYGSDRAAQLV